MPLVFAEETDGAREKEKGLPLPFSHPHATRASGTPHTAALNPRPHRPPGKPFSGWLLGLPLPWRRYCKLSIFS